MSDAKTIMWVDDEPKSIKWHVAALRREHYEVEIVMDAETALEKLLSAPDRYAALILDVLMPLGEAFPHHLPPDTTNERAGLEVARALRSSEHKQLRTLPIIIYSAMSGMALWPDMEAELRELGADILTKPIERRLLLRLVHNRIGRGEAEPM